jgi:lipopolysaccharide biosynthesis glycosyltransferase
MDSLMSEFDNLSLSFIDVGSSFSDTELVLKHTSLSTMYRLLLPTLLPDCDYCVYLDGDIIVTGDMSQVFDIDINEYYIGAVRDIEAKTYIDQFNYTDNRPDPFEYVNAGFLFMNLRKMRQDDLVSLFKELAKERFLFADQDIINISCKNNIKYLDLKYNVLVKYRFVNFKQNHYNDSICKYFTISEIHEAIDKPLMIHYAQPIKPWQCRNVYMGQVWHRYIAQNISKDIYSQYILPFKSDHKADHKTRRKLFVRRVLYKTGILKLLLNMQHKL